jgi:hypothetical protein
MGKLTVLHINIIGAVVAVIAGVALYFTIITAGADEIQKAKAEFDGVKARADKFEIAKNNLERAKKDQETAIAQYKVFEAQYMPIIGYPAERDSAAGLRTMMRLFWPNQGRSWPERFIRVFRNHMNGEQRALGVVWENPGVLTLPAYGPDPNTIQVAQPGEGYGPVLHYSYQMAVRATSLDRLMRHIANWNSLRGIGVPVVSGLQITGNSPELRASYTVTLTIILTDEEAKRIPPQNPRISGSGGQGGGGGFGPGGFGPGGFGPGFTAPGPGGGGSGGFTAPPGMGPSMGGPGSGGAPPPPGGRMGNQAV